jgi:hypothetical protein
MKLNTITKLFFLCLIGLTLNAQNKTNQVNSAAICKKIIPIDSLNFIKNKQEFARIDSITSFKKVKGIIKIKTKDSILTFKDHKTKNNLIEYSVVGQDKKNNWVLLLKEDYNQDYYYLINQKNNQVEKLVGYPMIFGNKLICQEGYYTDSTAFIEIWNSVKGVLKLENKFSFNSCKIFDINDVYIKKNILFVKYNAKNYFKLKL